MVAHHVVWPLDVLECLKATSLEYSWAEYHMRAMIRFDERLVLNLKVRRQPSISSGASFGVQQLFRMAFPAYFDLVIFLAKLKADEMA